MPILNVLSVCVFTLSFGGETFTKNPKILNDNGGPRGFWGRETYLGGGGGAEISKVFFWGVMGSLAGRSGGLYYFHYHYFHVLQFALNTITGYLILFISYI